ncbi:MAG: hypothetical protein ABL893_14320, partial [Hyphomicrobium sp.]
TQHKAESKDRWVCAPLDANLQVDCSLTRPTYWVPACRRFATICFADAGMKCGGFASSLYLIRATRAFLFAAADCQYAVKEYNWISSALK